MAECKCNCGYRCGGPGKCKLKPLECLRQADGKHYVKDCGHDWSGPVVEFDMGGAYCSSRTCQHCGATAMSHDMRAGA